MKTRNHVRLVTEVPGPKSRELLALRDRYVPGGVFNVVPVFAAEASGAALVDVDGNVFIDFAGGLGTLNVGSSHPAVTSALREQSGRFTHTCFHVVMYESYVRLAEQLTGLTPGDFPKKTLLVNSGAEAVENAIKIARKYTGRDAVITFENAFHGRTLLALTLTSKVRPYKFGFGPFAPEIYRLPYAYCYRCAFGLEYPGCELHCLDNVERIFTLDISPDQVAALIVEPVQGEGGFVVPPDEFLPGLRRICEKHGILFIADEIQTGFGRTGKMFAVEHCGVIPDLVTMAKSLAAGMPLSAVTGHAEVMESVHVGGIGGTYGGNPLGCVAALAVIEIIREEGLLERAARLGERGLQRFMEMKRRHALIGDVRGKGAMIALELVKDRKTKEPAPEETAKVIRCCYENGLIAMKAGVYNNVIRVLAPLVTSDEQFEEGLDILEGAIRKVSGG